MREDQLRLDAVRAKIKELQALEKKLEEALSKEHLETPIDERVAITDEFDE